MNNITQSEYANWLEDLIKDIVEFKPEKIGVTFMCSNGDAHTYYYGECYPQDKATMAYLFNSDAMMDTVLMNASLIVDAADEELNDYYDEDDFEGNYDEDGFTELIQ